MAARRRERGDDPWKHAGGSTSVVNPVVAASGSASASTSRGAVDAAMDAASRATAKLLTMIRKNLKAPLKQFGAADDTVSFRKRVTRAAVECSKQGEVLLGFLAALKMEAATDPAKRDRQRTVLREGEEALDETKKAMKAYRRALQSAPQPKPDPVVVDEGGAAADSERGDGEQGLELMDVRFEAADSVKVDYIIAMVSARAHTWELLASCCCVAGEIGGDSQVPPRGGGDLSNGAGHWGCARPT
jgi:hypothetical protein